MKRTLSLVLAFILVFTALLGMIPTSAAETETGKLKITKANLEFASTVYLLIAVDYTDVYATAEEAVAGVSITVDGERLTPDASVPAPEGSVGFKYKKLSAKEMGDELIIEAFAGDSAEADDFVSYSILEYTIKARETKADDDYLMNVMRKKNNIDGIIAIGGDGTFRGATDLSSRGIPTIGIPGTIDNDVTSTDVTIGFDTAMNTAMNMIDNLRDTCESHARCNVIEVMGRWAGHIALRTGIASGASVVAIAEVPFDEEAAIQKIIKQKSEGKRSFIVVVSEGLVGYAEKLAKTIQEKTGIETKFARLAHIQRGGKPTLQDRLLASEMGETAIQLLFEGKSDIVLTKVDGKIGYRNIKEALTVDRMFKKKLKPEEYEALSAEDKEWMEARCAAVQADMERLYAIANEIS